jgi:hypothetical protein
MPAVDGGPVAESTGCGAGFSGLALFRGVLRNVAIAGDAKKCKVVLPAHANAEMTGFNDD